MVTLTLSRALDLTLPLSGILQPRGPLNNLESAAHAPHLEPEEIGPASAQLSLPTGCCNTEV